MFGVKVQIPQAEIKSFCQKHHIVEFQLFGSVLREDFDPESDIDVLVTFAKDAHYTLFDLARLQKELSGILGRRADLVEKGSVERSENYIRRANILKSLVSVYVAR